jgi:hypothetical protein
VEQRERPKGLSRRLDQLERERILRDAPARLSLLRFEQEAGVVYAAAAADAFVAGYVDGTRGAALERAVAHRGRGWAVGWLEAFAYGWCRGRADLLGHRPSYSPAEAWLARRVRAFTATR